jgi:hypothetical protein
VIPQGHVSPALRFHYHPCLEEFTVHARPSFRLLAAAAALCTLGVRTAAAQTAAPPPQVTVSGVGYLQYLYQLKSSSGINNFDVTRAYVNVLGRFSGGVSTRITADISRPAGDNSLRYRLKYAFVGYTPTGSALTFKLGQTQTPLIDWEEALWDYRMQGQMAMERGGYLSSSDFGLAVDGKWGPDKVNLQVGVYNGESYSGGTGDQRKDAMGRVSVRVLDTDDSSRVGGLRVTGYGQVGQPNTGGKRQRYLGMVSYRSRRLTLAAEYAATRDTVTGPPAGALAKGKVVSVFGVYHLPNSKVAVVGRFDSTDPNTAVANNRLDRVIAGVSYQLSPNLRLLADWDHVSVEGSGTPGLGSTAYLHAQFTF